jgi:hypothetical protein
VLIKSAAKAVRICQQGWLARHHHEVNTAKPGLSKAEAFPDQPLDAISVNRMANVFLRNRQAQAGMTKVTTPGQNRHHPIG